MCIYEQHGVFFSVANKHVDKWHSKLLVVRRQRMSENAVMLLGKIPCVPEFRTFSEVEPPKIGTKYHGLQPTIHT